MKKIILLIIICCTIACQEDNQVAKVYENRQIILNECNNHYILGQVPGRGNFVLLRTYNDTNNRVITYTFVHKDHRLELRTVYKVDSSRMVTETTELLDFLSTFELTGLANFLTHPLPGEPRQLILSAKKYEYIYRPDSTCSQLDGYRSLGEGWYVKKDPYGGRFKRFWRSITSRGHYW
jgi:hypothetical protein